MALLPLRLLKAFWQCWQVVRRVKPHVLVGLGGYISFPGGMMGVLSGRPLVLHEQNAVAGLANKVLASVADRVFSTFPDVLPKTRWVGNPMREGFLNQPVFAVDVGDHVYSLFVAHFSKSAALLGSSKLSIRPLEELAASAVVGSGPAW